MDSPSRETIESILEHESGGCPAEPVMTITKTMPLTVAVSPGVTPTLNYTIVIANLTNGDLLGVRLLDELPSGMEVTTVTGDAQCDTGNFP